MLGRRWGRAAAECGSASAEASPRIFLKATLQHHVDTDRCSAPFLDDPPRPGVRRKPESGGIGTGVPAPNAEMSGVERAPTEVPGGRLPAPLIAPPVSRMRNTRAVVSRMLVIECVTGNCSALSTQWPDRTVPVGLRTSTLRLIRRSIGASGHTGRLNDRRCLKEVNLPHATSRRLSILRVE